LPFHTSRCSGSDGQNLNLTLHSTVISAFAIIILGTLGLLFNAEHPEMVGGEEDPANGHQVAVTVFIAVLIYAVSTRSCLVLATFYLAY
jgi:hypothetical protein